MRILLDQTGLALLTLRLQRAAQPDEPPCRCFAATAPLQTTVELWNQQTLETLANAVVEAVCTYGFGEPGVAWPEYEGRLHRHMQLFERCAAPADIALSQLILTGPRAETDAAAIPPTSPTIDLARWTAQRPLERRL